MQIKESFIFVRKNHSYILMAEKYTENHIIACYEADANQLLKPTAMLDWMQEVADRKSVV